MKRLLPILALTCLIGCAEPEGDEYTFYMATAEGMATGTKLVYLGVEVGEIVEVGLAPQEGGKRPKPFARAIVTDPAVIISTDDKVEIVAFGLLGENRIKITPPSDGPPNRATEPITIPDRIQAGPSELNLDKLLNDPGSQDLENLQKSLQDMLNQFMVP